MACRKSRLCAASRGAVFPFTASDTVHPLKAIRAGFESDGRRFPLGAHDSPFLLSAVARRKFGIHAYAHIDDTDGLDTLVGVRSAPRLSS